jgi:hypothetical protein
MSLDFLNDVFLLYLPLKAAQGVLEGLSLLQSDFCQLNYTPKLVLMGRIFIARIPTQVKRYCDRRPDERPLVSKAQSQCQLELAGSIGTVWFHKIRRNLINGREVAGSNEFRSLKELCGIANQAIRGKLESFIVPI